MVIGGVDPSADQGPTGTIIGAIDRVAPERVAGGGYGPAGQQILYGLIILLMLFIYGRSAKVRE